MDRNDNCWCGSKKKYKSCHLKFDEKIKGIKYSWLLGQTRPPRHIINNEHDIEGIKASAVINNGCLDMVGQLVKAGVDTETLDNACHEYIVSHGGIPACLNYEGYPKSVCISLNNVVCHGIPSKNTILKDGDILNIDITTIYNGYYADASRMFMVGNVSPEAEKLVRVTKECMDLGIAAAKPWHFLGDVNAACGNHALENGYTVVTALGGHGVGKHFHMEPYVAHIGEPNTGMLMVPGMVFTVEPMISAGRPEVDVDEEDGWTVTTHDGALSAQWEKTILITDTGAEVLAW